MFRFLLKLFGLGSVGEQLKKWDELTKKALDRGVASLTDEEVVLLAWDFRLPTRVQFRTFLKIVRRARDVADQVR